MSPPLPPQYDLLYQLLLQFTNATSIASANHGQLYQVGLNLFGVLAAIELIWSGILHLLARRGGDEVLQDFTRRVFFIFLAFGVWSNAPRLLTILFESFEKAGLYSLGYHGVGGDGAFQIVQILNPSYIMETGEALALKMVLLAAVNNWAPIPPAVFLVPALVVLIAFAICAALMLLTLIETLVVMASGFLFLAFASNRWTLGLSSNFTSYAFHMGVRLFFLTLIWGVAKSVIDQWLVLLGTAASPAIFFTDPRALLLPTIGSVALVVIILAVPRMAAKVVGTFGLSLGPGHSDPA